MSAKNLVTNFQQKSAKSSEVLLKICDFFLLISVIFLNICDFFLLNKNL